MARIARPDKAAGTYLIASSPTWWNLGPDSWQEPAYNGELGIQCGVYVYLVGGALLSVQSEVTLVMHTGHGDMATDRLLLVTGWLVQQLFSLLHAMVAFPVGCWM